MTLDSDIDLRDYFSNAVISPSRRGDGVFLGAGQRAENTSRLRKYGIPVSGGLIIPVRGNPAVEAERLWRLKQQIQYLLRDQEFEKEERERKAKHELAREEQKKKLLALEPLISEWQGLADDFKESLGTRIVRGENGEAELRTAEGKSYPIIYCPPCYDDSIAPMVRGCAMPQLVSFLEPVETARRELETEITISRNRKRNLPKVAALGALLEQELGMRIAYTSISDRITFEEKKYGWHDEDIQLLETTIKNALLSAQKADLETWARLTGAEVSGLPAEVKHKALRVGKQVFVFSNNQQSLEAYQWALGNGAIDEQVWRISKAIDDGADAIESVGTGIYGSSSDHMRRGEYRRYMLGSYIKHGAGWKFVGSCEIGGPDEPLHKIAVQLLEEKKKAMREIELAQLQIKIVIDAKESRAKGHQVVSVMGLFSEAIETAIKKIDKWGHPRRGYDISILSFNTDGSERRKLSIFAMNGEDVTNKLAQFEKDKLL